MTAPEGKLPAAKESAGIPMFVIKLSYEKWFAI